MKNNILDYELDDDSKKKPSMLNWAAVILLWMGIVLCILEGMIGNLKIILAALLLAGTTIYRYRNFENGTKTTMFVILVGVLGFIEFFPFLYEHSFGFGGLRIRIEFVMLSVAIFFYFTNREYLKEPEKNISEEEKNINFNKSKESFKRQFAGRGMDDLRRIVEDGKHVAPAIAAAKELIGEKEKKSENIKKTQ
ncbi:MAG: hypothetical protein AAFZ15_12475 [Bacteroidota bacterium]